MKDVCTGIWAGRLDVGGVMFRMGAGAPAFIPSLKHPDILEGPLSAAWILSRGKAVKA